MDELSHSSPDVDSAGSRECGQQFPANGKRVRVVVERIDGGTAYDQNAGLIDISTSGARISTSTPVRFNEAVLLRIENEELGIRISAPARVCAIRTHGLVWSLGCSFDPPLSTESLIDLFRHGIVQRRQHVRRSVKAQGKAQWDTRPEVLPVDLVDLSQGGFRLRCSTSAIPGSRLVLFLERRDGQVVEISGITKWQEKKGHVCLIGCQFVCAESYEQLLDAIGEEKPCVACRQSPRKLAVHVLAVAIAGLCAELAFAAQR